MKSGKVVQWVLLVLILLGVPLYLSSDSFLKWLVEKSFASNWKSAPTVHYDVASFYRWTGRTERSAHTFELFINRYSGDARVPEAVYLVAVGSREVAAELDMTAKGDLSLIEKRTELKKKAGEWYDYFAVTYPNHPKAEVARRAAQAIRDGY